ncbi:MAG: exonuclease domain-containing protein [Zhongshania sp.]|uniref:exonuclease domain-containing protein n=1 Tax=Zhongshania sp. TaxID=1971902 RepID=UPI002604CCAA|nr:exonuclease domain-containing protein [Zhongshania sp.]MDF1692937.1 exonuclease domain-containing protein [Zhongshania sp.]
MLADYRFALVDLETTGGQAAHDQIMEAAVRLLDGERELEWQSLLDPGCAVPAFIQGLTGIHTSMVRGKPSFSEVQETLWSYLDEAILVAHNARFDAGFLRANFARVGRNYQPRVLCTLKLARTLYPDWPRHGLEAVCERIGFYSEVHHRAMADVDAMKAFLDFARADKGEAVFNFEVGLLVGLPVLPPSISQADVDAIPNQPGIYRLLGEAGELLYLGSASALQAQVLRHFENSAADSKAAKLARRIYSVEWQALAGDLSAALHLSAALKFEKPLLQRRAKALGKPCCVRFISGDNGDVQLRLRSGLPANIAKTGELVALFRDRKHAKTRIAELAIEYQLCLRRLGLVADGEKCGCRACALGEAASGMQGVAVAEAALAGYLYEPWPFTEPVLIYEQNAAGASEWHLVDDWRHYGSFIWDATLAQLFELSNRATPLSLAAVGSRCEQTKELQYEHYRLLRAFRDDLRWLPVSQFTEQNAR